MEVKNQGIQSNKLTIDTAGSIVTGGTAAPKDRVGVGADASILARGGGAGVAVLRARIIGLRGVGREVKNRAEGIATSDEKDLNLGEGGGKRSGDGASQLVEANVTIFWADKRKVDEWKKKEVNV